MRGGYTIEDAVQIQRAIQLFVKKTDAISDGRPQVAVNTEQSAALKLLFDMLEKSQSLGTLKLVEAWTVYNAMCIFDAGGDGGDDARE